MARILSGIRTTGKLHLGHLVGIIKNWVEYQEKYECFYMLADWHVLTDRLENVKETLQSYKDIVKALIKSGLDPKKVTIFRQSAVKEHAELFLLFGMVLPIPYLLRNPTLKDHLANLRGKGENSDDLSKVSYGLLGYPVLQAADILIYKAGYVPVGVDQLPHLELTREIARRFNNYFGTDFPEPEPILSDTPKLLGTDKRKMSKSYNNAIYLDEEPESIQKKVMSMVTDPNRIKKTDPGNPEICNVFSYYKAFFPQLIQEVEHECKNAKTGCVACKKRLSKLLIDMLAVYREEDIDDNFIEEILEQGASKARTIARKTLEEIREKIGLK